MNKYESSIRWDVRAIEHALCVTSGCAERGCIVSVELGLVGRDPKYAHVRLKHNDDYLDIQRGANWRHEFVAWASTLHGDPRPMAEVSDA